MTDCMASYGLNSNDAKQLLLAILNYEKVHLEPEYLGLLQLNASDHNGSDPAAPGLVRSG